MNFSTEQTPLLSNSRTARDRDRRDSRGGQYAGREPLTTLDPTTMTTTMDSSLHPLHGPQGLDRSRPYQPLPIPQPPHQLQYQRQHHQQPSSEPLSSQQQHLDRAHLRHEQAHAITARHWLVLLLACLLLFGNYYCYDIPAALNVQLEEWLDTDYATHQYQLNLLYSVYSLPNIVLPLLGGYLIDRLSASRMLVLFSLCICLGQGVFALGVSTKSIGIMVLGRFLFGIGGECLEVAQAKITTDWFKSRWLGFALGLNLSSARIATALNDNLSPWIATRTRGRDGGGVVGASWAGFAVCVMSLISGIGLAHLDRPKSRVLAGVRLDARDRRGADRIRSRKDNLVGREAINVSCDSTMTLSSEALEEEEAIEKENEMAEDDEMVYSEIFTLQTNFWILCLCCISLYGAVVPFIHISSGFLQKKWYRKDPARAGAVMSIPDIVSSIGSPLCGYLVDRFGHRARYIPLSALFLILAHLQLGFTMLTPVLAMFILGLAYSLFASVLWPCIPFLVKDHQLGTAYGLVTIALNISLTVFPMLVASILHGTKGSYMAVEGLFVGLAAVGLGLSVLLNVLDQRQGGLLQRSGEGHEDLAGEDEHNALLDGQDPYRYVGHHQGQEIDGLEAENLMRAGIEREHRSRTSSIAADEDEMVTTKVVAEGVVTIIPHRRRISMTGFQGHLERSRLRNYAQYARNAPELNAVPGSLPNEPSLLAQHLRGQGQGRGQTGHHAHQGQGYEDGQRFGQGRRRS